MKLFRSLVLFTVAWSVGFVAFAQVPSVFAGAANAYAFAYGVNQLAAPLLVDMAGGPTTAGATSTITVAFGTVKLGDGTIITPLKVGVPIKIGTGDNADTVTPTAVSCNTPQVYQSCSFTATSITHSHGTGDRISSGSYGIQEAGAYMAGKYGEGLVIVDSALMQAAGISDNSAVASLITGLTSVGTKITVLNYSGIPGALSYQNTAGSSYASTTHIIY